MYVGLGHYMYLENMHAPQTGSQWWCCSAKSMQQEPRPCARKSGAKANSKHQPHPRCTWACTWAWAITCIWQTCTHRRRGHNGGVAPPKACSRNHVHVHPKAEPQQVLSHPRLDQQIPKTARRGISTERFKKTRGWKPKCTTHRKFI